MGSLFHAELLKARSARTLRGLTISLALLVVLVVLLHTLKLPLANVTGRSHQLEVYGWGTVLGALFAALAGGIQTTMEFRYGTIRTTFLVTPNRLRVIAAKVAASALLGFIIGLIAEALAAVTGSIGFSARGVHIALDAGNFALLIAGGAVAAALCAAIGVGVGTAVRAQVPTLVGIAVWMILLETLLLSFIPSVGRFGPTSAAGALAGASSGAATTKLLAPAAGAAMLLVWVALSLAAGLRAILDRDVA